jgi:hypothetical protein
MNAKVQQFISNLVAEFQLDEARVNEMWKMVDTAAPVTTTKETPVTTTKETPVTTKCSHIFTKGTKEGEKCGKAVRKGSDLCSVHAKSCEKKIAKVSFSCNHTFNKGTKEGKKCSVKVTSEHGFCSKHAEKDKKMSMKKWEDILFSQIPEILVKYYKNEKDYMDGAKLTRATANNVAAWIMVKYDTYFVHEDPADYFNGMVDFHEQMRDALMASDFHPLDKIAHDDEEEWREYHEMKV